MKFLLLVFLFGFVAANFDDAFRRARDEILESYREGLKSSPSLSEALDLPYSEELDEIQARFDADNEEKLKNKLDGLVEKMKDAVDKGKQITQDVIDKFEELKKKLKEKGGELHDKAKEKLKEMKQKYKELWEKLMDELKQNKRSVELSDDSADDINDKLDKIVEKMKDAIDKGHNIGQDLIDKYRDLKQKLKEKGGKLREKVKNVLEKIKQIYNELLEKMIDNMKQNRRSIREEFELASEGGFNMKDLLNKLREKLKEHLNFEKMKEFIKEKFGEHKQLIQVLVDQLKEHGKTALKKLIDELLGNKEARSLKEIWEKIKQYFKDLGIDAKEKYLQFLEWLKERKNIALENAKDKIEKLKIIAKEFIEHHKNVSKEVALEALEFMRPYKEDLKDVWQDFKKSVNEVLKNKE